MFIGNVRSDCYGYATTVSRGVQRGYIIYISSSTLFRIHAKYLRGRNSTCLTSKAISGPQSADGRDGSPRRIIWINLHMGIMETKDKKGYELQYCNRDY